MAYAKNKECIFLPSWNFTENSTPVMDLRLARSLLDRDEKRFAHKNHYHASVLSISSKPLAEEE